MRKLITLVTVIASLALGAGVAQAGDAVTIQGNIAHYEGAPLNHVHITQVLGGASGTGQGWDCQSWWIWNGGELFYAYYYVWTYPFSYQNNGARVEMGSAHTNWQRCS